MGKRINVTEDVERAVQTALATTGYLVFPRNDKSSRAEGKITFEIDMGTRTLVLEGYYELKGWK